MTFFETVTAAVNDFIAYGYDSEERIAYWIDALREAAVDEMIPEAVLDQKLRSVLVGAYQGLIDNGSIMVRHPGVDRFTLERIRPKLRAELDRRLLASANLIKLNRANTINDTLRRFQGWATSIPPGGTLIADKKDTKNHIRAELASNDFRERRVMIDQAHKLNSALSDIIAQDTGAIAAVWRSHWKQRNYNFRQEHKERDMHVYVTRDSWAIKAKLIKPDPKDGFYEDHERPGEFVFCRCYVKWLYALRDLPDKLLTNKGREALASARATIAAA